MISATIINEKLPLKQKPRKRKDSVDSDRADAIKHVSVTSSLALFLFVAFTGFYIFLLLNLCGISTTLKEKSRCPLLMEYMMNSTIHGVRYFVEGSRHWIER